MRKKRQSGMLLHITSLPSRGGVGTLGRAAYDFVDFLRKAGLTIWQMLPVGPTGYGESPYQSASTYAGEPLLIDADLLRAQGLLDEDSDFEGDPDSVLFDEARKEKRRLLERACELSYDKLEKEIDAYRALSPWLDDYALYAAIKEDFSGAQWTSWPDAALRRRDPIALEAARERLSPRVRYHLFTQYIFDGQWTRLKKYANERGVRLFGDMPIYVAEDSADTWTHPEVFRLDADGRPVEVAGVPPDYFSEDGQKWGNPLYDWDALYKTRYAWWVERVRAAALRFDMLRIDHFIGFANYYAIPAGAKNARTGRWIVGPGRKLFRVLKKEVPDLYIVAEDLGVVSARVKRLLRYCGYPGMRVVVFGFGGEKNMHNPARYKENCIAYTGTHDNDTVVGWWARVDAAEKAEARAALGPEADTDIADAVIRAALKSRAGTVIVPLQDYLGLDNRARMNLPGTCGGNWRYRARADALNEALILRIRALNTEYHRG